MNVNTSSGMGTIKCGSIVSPFDNTISKDTNNFTIVATGGL